MSQNAYSYRLFKDLFPAGVSGYVNHQVYMDTSQAIGQAADSVIFLPFPVIRDPDGYNIAAKGEAGQASFVTRCRANMAMQPIGNVKPSLFVESDFFGNTNILELGFSVDNLNVMRMRHAFAVLEWDNKSLLYGYTWHPMYMFDCCPNNLSFNRGSPLAFISRAPQVSFSYHAPIMDITVAASSQIDFINLGPRGGLSEYLRHAVVPDLTGLLRFYVRDHFFGCALDYKRLVPRLVTNAGYKAYEHIDSGVFAVFAVANTERMHLKTQWFYAQNANNLSVLGGFAVSSIDPKTDRRTYTNLAYSGWWIDSEVRLSERWGSGILCSVIFNNGSRKPIILSHNGEITIYSFLQMVSKAMRLAPRLHYIYDHLDVGMEIEYVRSYYGTVTRYGQAVRSVPASNVRGLLVLTYLF